MEKALYFPSILPGRKRKLPKLRLQCLIRKQGIWFELAESTPPPDTHRHTHTHIHIHTPGLGSVLSQEARPASALQLSLWIPAQLSRPAGRHSPAAPRPAEWLTGDAPGAGGSFASRLGALQGGGGARDGRSKFHRPKRVIKSLTNRSRLAARSGALCPGRTPRAGSARSPLPGSEGAASSPGPHPAEGRLGLSPPRPPGLPRRRAHGAGAWRGGKGSGGGGRRVFVPSAIPFQTAPCLSFPRPGDIGWRVLQCVYERRECVYTPLPLRANNSALIHGELCAHTPPSGRPRVARRRLLCSCPRLHTPQSRAKGWTFQSRVPPLTPPSALPPAVPRAQPANRSLGRGNRLGARLHPALCHLLLPGPFCSDTGCLAPVPGTRAAPHAPQPQPCHPGAGAGVGG